MNALTPVRLSDVPFHTRMAAARTLAQKCVTPLEAHEVLAAALWPSDRTYYVTTDRVEEAQAA